ncbi:MAG TPA: diphthine--ammonia ligase [Bacillales bacterium]|nr:diphthine--ammonia ligase [Bacillales bacterium]
MEDVLFSWSGGKDSALALCETIRSGRWNVRGLLTTAAENGRVPMHECRTEVIERQAKAVGVPLISVVLPEAAANETYEKRIEETLIVHKNSGVNTVVHGDIFLEDVKAFREQQLQKIGFSAKFPLWGRDSRQLAEQFVSERFRAKIVCVDTDVLDASWLGSEYDQGFLDRLPDHVDPCGENGEFHTIVYDGPIFRHPVRFQLSNTFTSHSGRFHHLVVE